MLRQTPSRRSGLSAQGNSGLEPARESRSSCHRMEIYSQAGPQKTWRHNHAVTVLEQAKQFVAGHANCSDQEATDLLEPLRREQQQNLYFVRSMRSNSK